MVVGCDRLMTDWPAAGAPRPGSGGGCWQGAQQRQEEENDGDSHTPRTRTSTAGAACSPARHQSPRPHCTFCCCWPPAMVFMAAAACWVPSAAHPPLPTPSPIPSAPAWPPRPATPLPCPAGQVRVPTHIVSTICDDRGEEPTYCGVNMSELIEGDYGIGESRGGGAGLGGGGTIDVSCLHSCLHLPACLPACMRACVHACIHGAGVWTRETTAWVRQGGPGGGGPSHAAFLQQPQHQRVVRTRDAVQQQLAPPRRVLARLALPPSLSRPGATRLRSTLTPSCHNAAAPSPPPLSPSVTIIARRRRVVAVVQAQAAQVRHKVHGGVCGGGGGGEVTRWVAWTQWVGRWGGAQWVVGLVGRTGFCSSSSGSSVHGWWLRN